MKREDRERNQRETARTARPVSAQLLLVVLRGESFRSGGQHSRYGTFDVSGQLRAFVSIRTQLVAPAKRVGWSCAVLADVAVPIAHVKTFGRLARDVLQAATVRISNPAPTQVMAVLRTLAWVLAIVHNPWAAMIMTRADLEIKTLQLSAPRPRDCSILVPFETLDGRGVADTIIYIPWCRFTPLLLELANRTEEQHLHGLCGWVDDVRFWLPHRYDANTQKDHNPMYRMVSRPEQRAGAVERHIRQRKGWPSRPHNGGMRQCRKRSNCTVCLAHDAARLHLKTVSRWLQPSPTRVRIAATKSNL